MPQEGGYQGTKILARRECDRTDCTQDTDVEIGWNAEQCLCYAHGWPLVQLLAPSVPYFYMVDDWDCWDD